MAEDDGSGNWPHSTAAEIAASKAEILALINEANDGLANLSAPQYWDALGNQVLNLPYEADAKVEWLLDESDIVFIDNSAKLSDMRADRGKPRLYHDELGGKQETHLNVFLYEDPNETSITGWGHGPFTSTPNVGAWPTIINMYAGYVNRANTGGYSGFLYVWGNNFNHELFHALSGFGHTDEESSPVKINDLPAPDRMEWVSPSASNREISNNLMGGSKNQDYLSPKQVRLFHQGIMSRVCRKYVANLSNLNPEHYVYTVSGYVIWDKLTELNNDLDIEPGATLVLKGCLLMSVDAVVNVKPGAHLLLDGGGIHISFPAIDGIGLGGSLWGGVKVWGHKNMDQGKHPNHFGKVSATENGGSISRATTAISTSKLDYGDVFDWSECGGGIIQLKNCSLKNNQRDIQMLSYKTQNSLNYVLDDLSFFDGCHFLTTSELILMNDHTVNNELIPYYEPNVTLWDVHGVRFSQCQFVNSRTKSQWDGYLGSQNPDVNRHLARIGLATFNAYARVQGVNLSGWDGPNPPYVGNHFEGLHTGILIRGTNGVAEGLYLKNNNTFHNCGMGIDLQSSSNDVLDNNQMSWDMDYFEILFQLGTEQSGWALQDTRAQGVFFQGHTVSSAIPLTQARSGAGIISFYHDVNSGGLYHFNSFTNCFPSVQLEANLGQRLTCNSFINDGFPNEANTDLYHNMEVRAGALAQGLCDPDLGWLPQNQFQENCNSSKDHIENKWQNLKNTKIVYVVNPAEPAATQPQSTCIYQSNKIQLTSCSSVSLTTCGSIAASGNDGQNNGDYYQSMQRYEGFVQASEALLASGNDPLLQSRLQDPAEVNATLEGDLVALRPYLSDALLVAVIERQPAFATNYVKDVLIEHSPISEAVQSSLDNHPLPQADMDAIEAAQATAYGLVHQENDFLEAAYWERARNAAGYQQALRDTVLGDSLCLDSFLNFFNVLGGRGHLGKQINALIEIGNYTAAAAKLATLDLNDTEEADLYAYENLHLTLQQSNRNWFQVDAAELLVLENLAINDTRGAGFAESILILIGEKPFPMELPENATSTEQSGSTGLADVQPANSYQELQLYPNPSQGQLTVVLPQYQAGNPAALCRIYSVKGTLMHHQELTAAENQLDLSTLPKGLYLVQVLQGEHTLRSSFVID